jgi:hypothetical protein
LQANIESPTGSVIVCRSELGLGGIPTINGNAACLMDRIG